MVRFRKYIDRELKSENVKDARELDAYGVTCTYLPDPIEDFDELEFRTEYNGKNNIVITITLELGKIKRAMFSVADEVNPDIVRALTESQLEGFLSNKGEKLLGFFDYITQ